MAVDTLRPLRLNEEKRRRKKKRKKKKALDENIMSACAMQGGHN